MSAKPIAVTIVLACLVSAPAGAAATATEMIPMKDGVRLATDVYLPAQGGPWPVLLARTPYDKDKMAQTGIDIQNSNLAAAVIQDLRGRFHSEGIDCIFSCDAGDGADTIAWVLAQPWCNGKVMTHGGSALGIVQYMLAPEDPVGLVGMIVDVATPDLYDFMFPGGVFRQNDVEGWLAAQGSTFWLDNVKEHPFLDSHWEPVTASAKFDKVNVPALHAGGWFDIFTQGTIDAFTGYQTRGGAGARGKQKMVIGPWSHGARGKEQGELIFPDNATQDAIKLGDTTLTWMFQYLGIQNRQAQIDAIPAVQYYTMGACGEAGAPGNEWRSADEWPVRAAPTKFYLHDGSVLSIACPTAELSTSTWVYDPSNPSPTFGGANLTLLSGPQDQIFVEQRPDVAIFSTGKLATPFEVTGRVKAHLWVSVDTPDTDLHVRLTDVYPDGRSMLITDGPLRVATRGKKDGVEVLKTGEVVEAVVDVGSTSMIFNAGHRIRIVVSSSNAPRFYPNPNNGEYYGTTKPPRVANVTLYHDKDHPSYLEAPNPNSDPAAVNRCGEEMDGGTDDGGADDDGGTDGGTCEVPDATTIKRCEGGTDRREYEGLPCGEAGEWCRANPCQCAHFLYFVDCRCERCVWRCSITDCCPPDAGTDATENIPGDGGPGTAVDGSEANEKGDPSGCGCSTLGL